jgi:hypothetical protein
MSPSGYIGRQNVSLERNVPARQQSRLTGRFATNNSCRFGPLSADCPQIARGEVACLQATPDALAGPHPHHARK